MAAGSTRARRWVGPAAAGVALVLVGVAVRSRGEAPAPAPPPMQAVQPELPVSPAAVASVPAPAAASEASGPASSAAMPTASEDELMRRLRAEVDADPRAALALADDGDRRFDGTQYSDERAFLRMRALVHLGDIGMARDAARRFYERYPESPLARYVFRLTGMRPAPRLGPP